MRVRITIKNLRSGISLDIEGELVRRYNNHIEIYLEGENKKRYYAFKNRNKGAIAFHYLDRKPGVDFVNYGVTIVPKPKG